MSAGYVIARENFKEAARHVSAESDPVMFNLLYGLQSLAEQIEADFAAMAPPAASAVKTPRKHPARKPPVRTAAAPSRKTPKKARAKSR
jgi:hypothetical protein